MTGMVKVRVAPGYGRVHRAGRVYRGGDTLTLPAETARPLIEQGAVHEVPSSRLRVLSRRLTRGKGS